MDAPDVVAVAPCNDTQLQTDIQAVERLYRAMPPEQRSFFHQQIKAHLEGAPNIIDRCAGYTCGHQPNDF